MLFAYGKKHASEFLEFTFACLSVNAALMRSTSVGADLTIGASFSAGLRLSFVPL